LTHLDISSNAIGEHGLVCVASALKAFAIMHQQACVCPVGNEPSPALTKDLRALLVVTRNLNKPFSVPGSHLAVEIIGHVATWL
jgi:hypothetical protein